MSATARWIVAGLVTILAFGFVTWITGALALERVMRSDADRWVVAAGLGVAVAALAALWGHSWATREGAAPSGNERSHGPNDLQEQIAQGKRSIAARDISGIASTGDEARNTQQR